jgi:DNA-binding transcriptional regulator YiaG
LRRALGLTQQGLADEIGVRQQTVSEWETGAYLPRGASVRLLDIVAERAAAYETASEAGSGSSGETELEAGRDP